jgi:DNA-binding MarR family transcriptional regulator
MAGVLVTSIWSGRVISRVGRYRPFPIAGTAFMTLGFVFLSEMDDRTSGLGAAWRLLLLGLGLGLVMQILVVVAQNAVSYRDLGVATSGSTLFRLIGGSVGTAVFGAIFSNRLTSELAGRVPAAGQQQGRLSPTQLHQLPPQAHDAYIHAFTNALSDVFVVAAGVCALGILLSLVLPDQQLRDTVEATGPPDHFAVPRSDDALAEIERALSVLARRDVRKRLYERLARDAGIDLPALEAWTLARIYEGAAGPVEELASRIGVEPARVTEATEELERRGLVARSDGWFSSTQSGGELVERLVRLRRERLASRLADCTPEEEMQFAQVLDRLARDLLAEPPGDRRPATASMRPD